MELTPLEQVLVDATAARHWPSFKTDALQVTTRDNTGVGRFTHVEDLHHQSLPAGYHSIEQVIAMDGVPHGMGWVIWVEDGRIDHIEIFTYGSAWDGTERSWHLVSEDIDLESI
jgi:hypothetical protein